MVILARVGRNIHLWRWFGVMTGFDLQVNFGSRPIADLSRHAILYIPPAERLKMRPVILMTLGSVGFILGGCDGWPTRFSNQTPVPVSLSYWHSSYDRPSATLRLDAGESMLLAREHRLRDFKEIRVVEDGRAFIISEAVLSQLKEDCPTYQCILTYSGGGRLSARPWTNDDANEDLSR